MGASCADNKRYDFCGRERERERKREAILATDDSIGEDDRQVLSKKL